MAATTSPSGSDEFSNTGRRSGNWEATAMAERKPASMAMPPRVGVGRLWTLRSSGLTTAPQRTASRHTAGVSTHVTKAATPATRA
jgi:hypothetical protein